MKTSQFSQLLSLSLSRTKTELKGAEKGNSQAFTLIELLLVIAIVGILAGIVMVGMSDAVDRARIAKIQGWSDSVRTSLMGSRVSEWKFDEAAGTLALDTVGTNNGMLYNGTAWTTSSCVSGSCLEFDGVDDFVSCQGIADFIEDNKLKTVALGVWVKIAEIKAGQIIGQSQSHVYAELEEEADGKVHFWMENSLDADYYVRTNNSLSDGKWHYVVGQYDYDAKKMKIWVDSALNNYANYTFEPVDIVDNFRIGYGDGSFFKGELDEVRVYSAALTASAIRDNYLAGLDRLLAGGAVTEEEYRQRLADLDSIYAARE